MFYVTSLLGTRLTPCLFYISSTILPIVPFSFARPRLGFLFLADFVATYDTIELAIFCVGSLNAHGTIPVWLWVILLLTWVIFY